MKNRHSLRALVSLLLIFCLLFSLCACPGSGDPNPDPDPEPDPTPDPEPDDTLFGNGAGLAGTGAELPEGCFALTPHTAASEGVIEITAKAFMNLFRSTGPEEGKTYRITDDAQPTVNGVSGRTYNGNGAVVIAPAGMKVQDANSFTLSNLTVIAETADAITVTGGEGLIFENVDAQSPAHTAFLLDGTNTEVVLNGCRLSGKTALALSESGTTVLNSTFHATEYGIHDSAASGTTVHNCTFDGSGTGIASGASEANFRRNTVKLGATDTGILLAGKGINSLIAQNIVTGAQDSIVVREMTNTVVVYNSAVSLVAENGHSLYFCDNALGGVVRATNNQYMLADGNTYPSDGKSHTAVQTGNENQSGDTLTDVTRREEAGVNEDLLPKVDRDLFVGMERREIAYDCTDEEPTVINTYVTQHAETDDVVIVAPGAYRAKGPMNFTYKHNNTTVYAYGVYYERETGLGKQMGFSGASDITIKGLILAYAQQSCGQVYVMKKLTGSKVLVATGAGMMNEFGNTNTSYYNTLGMGAQHAGDFYAFCDTSFSSITKNADGTMTMMIPAGLYNAIDVGDVFTCRASNGETAVFINSSSGVSFVDVTLYGGAAGFAFVEGSNLSATTYLRVLDTTRTGELIDEATYEKYTAWEEAYGMDFEMRVDDLGRYRGSPAHIGSIDATHTTKCVQGSVCISCLFENMCDDGTNQNAAHARLSALTDNGDGTATITYKGNWSQYNYEQHGAGNGYCAPFVKGDRVYIYTSAGRLVCDSAALENGVRSGSGTNGINGGSYDLYRVTVASADVNFAAIDGYDLTNDSWKADEKVLVDNMSKTSSGFLFDNCLVQNIRSRALLIKSSDGKIVNCTFRNIGMSCAAILYEIYWGESGVSENLVIADNVFDHTGYFRNTDLYAPISIYGLGSKVEDDYLLYSNIQITGNVMLNRTTDYAVYVNSAKNVTISNNDFGTVIGEDEDHPSAAIHILGAKDINIFGNRFSPFMTDICDAVIAEKNRHVYGDDVQESNGDLIIPDDLG